jgi:hypothetical protein
MSRYSSVMVLFGAAVVLALTACGGGGTTEVNGCEIEPNTVCQGADLSGADLSGEDLTGANLSRADLTDADLSNANLTEANLAGARIVDANLDDSNLTRTNLEGATILDTDLAGTTRCGTIRTDGTIDDTSCPSSGGTTTTTVTTTTTAAAPEILSWTGPPNANCQADTEVVTLTFRWRTRNAEAIDFEVDGVPPGASAGAGPSGSIDLPFECSKASHTYTLTASNAAGETVTKDLTVTSD